MLLKSFANPRREFGRAEQQENADKELGGAGEYTGLVLRTEIYPNGCVCVGEGRLCKTIDREQVNQVGYGLGKSVYADQDNTGVIHGAGCFGVSCAVCRCWGSRRLAIVAGKHHTSSHAAK